MCVCDIDDDCVPVSVPYHQYLPVCYVCVCVSRWGARSLVAAPQSHPLHAEPVGLSVHIYTTAHSTAISFERRSVVETRQTDRQAGRQAARRRDTRRPAGIYVGLFRIDDRTTTMMEMMLQGLGCLLPVLVFVSLYLRTLPYATLRSVSP